MPSRSPSARPARPLQHARRALMLAALPLLAGGLAAPAAAQQAWPNKPIKVIFGFAAGGGTDAVVRAICAKLSEALNVPVIVDNRPGANANIAGEAVAKAAGDGYTLLYNTSSIAISPALYLHLPYDAMKDLVPIGLTASIPLVLVASPSAPFSNMKEFVAYLKAHPGQVNYGSSSPGNITHLAAAQILTATGTSAEHVPYKSEAPALTDLLGGHIQFYAGNANAIIPQLKEKKLKGLAVTSLKRIESIPDVPTLAETIKPGMELGAWSGFMAPASTPPEIVAKLANALDKALQDPDLRAKIAATDAEVRWMPPAQYKVFLGEEIKRWGTTVKAAGLKPE